MVETDDEAYLEALSDRIKNVLCPPDDDGPDHRCDPPWMIVTSPMRKKQAKGWRKILNR